MSANQLAAAFMALPFLALSLTYAVGLAVLARSERRQRVARLSRVIHAMHGDTLRRLAELERGQ